jgi:glycosyltransferase involved in cell wall biosynthesis
VGVANRRRPESADIGHEPESKAFCGSHDGILCLGGEDWWYHNRAHFDMQIMRCMAQKMPVLYANSVGFRMPSVKEGAQFLHRIGRKLRSVARPISNPFAGFYVASLFSVPLWHRPLLANLNVLSLEVQIRKACRDTGLKHPLLWVACPTAFEVVRRVRGDAFLVYQRTDKFEEYSQQTQKYLIAADRWLAEHANLVLYVSTALYEEERERNPQSFLVRHGVELGQFDRDTALQAGTPADLVAVKRPIVGFYGEIEDDTVDMTLVGQVARSLPDVSFVFVGRFIADPSPVRGLPNVHFVGKKPYEEVPRYGAQFDVAIMPWKRNRWIHYCNPIKLKEYLALGLPVVSTAFPEALHYRDVIYVAHNGDDFVRGIREALAGHGVGNVESRRARVSGDTWEQTALYIAETINKLAGQGLTKNVV